MIAKRRGWLARGAFFLFSSRGLGAVLHTLSGMVLVRALSQHDYGVYGHINLIRAVLVPVVTLGLPNGFYYFIPQLSTSLRKVFFFEAHY